MAMAALSSFTPRSPNQGARRAASARGSAIEFVANRSLFEDTTGDGHRSRLLADGSLALVLRLP